jgi:hypothetical protein
VTSLDEIPNLFAAQDTAPVVPTPRRHKHVWYRVADDTGNAAFICMSHAEPVVRDETKARRGKSSRRLGHDGERRSEKRYGWRKVGEYGGITDLEGTLAIVQQKTSRRAPPAAWLSIFRALEARSGGRIPLVLLSFVRAGVDTEDFIVLRGRDWLALHGLDQPEGTAAATPAEGLHDREET